MKTWNDYKEHVKDVDPVIAKDMEEVKGISSIVSAMVEQRTTMGLANVNLPQCVEFHNPPLPGLNPAFFKTLATVLRDTPQLCAMFRSLNPKLFKHRISRYLVIIVTSFICIHTKVCMYSIKENICK